MRRRRRMIFNVGPVLVRSEQPPCVSFLHAGRGQLQLECQHRVTPFRATSLHVRPQVQIQGSMSCFSCKIEHLKAVYSYHMLVSRAERSGCQYRFQRRESKRREVEEDRGKGREGQRGDRGGCERGRDLHSPTLSRINSPSPGEDFRFLAFLSGELGLLSEVRGSLLRSCPSMIPATISSDRETRPLRAGPGRNRSKRQSTRWPTILSQLG